MKRILMLCSVTILVPGIMAGCSKNEQSAQQPSLPEPPSMTMADTLQGKVTQASDQAQEVVGEAKPTAGEALEAFQAQAAETTTEMKEQLQGVDALTDKLQADVKEKVQMADAELADLTKEAAPIPVVPDQAVVPPETPAMEDLIAVGTESPKTQLDSVLTDLNSEVANTNSEAAQAGSEAQAIAAEAGATITDEAANVTEANATASDKVAETVNDTTSAQIWRDIFWRAEILAQIKLNCMNLKGQRK